MATNKKQASLRLTDTGRQLLRDTAEKLGVSQSAAMEIAIRLLAQRESVEARPAPNAAALQAQA